MIAEEKFVKSFDGIELRCQIYEKNAGSWLIVSHGICEHLGRHKYILDLLSHHYNILFYDLRGHGKSMGKRVYVEDFSLLYQDLKSLVDFIKTQYKAESYSLYGHSMGALITSGFLKKFASEEFYPEKVFLSGPPVGIPGFLGKIVDSLPKSAFSLLSSLPTGMYLKGLVDLTYISHDPRVIVEYQNDELAFLKVHTITATALVDASKDIFSSSLDLKCEAFCAYGSEDGVVSPSAISDYFSNIEKGFELRVFEGAYHEMHNEVEKYRKPYFEYLKECFING